VAGQTVFMSKLIHAISDATARAEPRPAQPVAAASPLPKRPLGRPDSLTAQRIEVGLILHTMLGMSAASDYLARQSVSAKVMQRVLSESGRRRRSDSDAQLG
jgi:hypothetical protein